MDSHYQSVQNAGSGSNQLHGVSTEVVVGGMVVNGEENDEKTVFTYFGTAYLLIYSTFFYTTDCLVGTMI